MTWGVIGHLVFSSARRRLWSSNGRTRRWQWCAGIDGETILGKCYKK